MPLPRNGDSSGGAPVLDILNARVRLFEVEEHVEPYTVTRGSDGATFTLDPSFTCQVEVVDDGGDGSLNGTTFYEHFRYKWNKMLERWENAKNSKLGAVTEVRKPGYFEDESIPDLEKSDLEDFEMYCRLKPRKTPAGKVVGTTIDWETMRAVPEEQEVPAGRARAA
jgi:hypothetical protein